METCLYLIPAPLGEITGETVFDGTAARIARCLRAFAVETPKTARAHLKSFAHPGPIAELKLIPMDDADAVARVLELLRSGEPVGVLSDAGCPCVADPGAPLVRAAHEAGFPVKPLVGPSSLLLALMASGMNGQRFRFLGYLPIPATERIGAIRELEAQSARDRETQIFIETPYRNDALLRSLLDTLRDDTWLCLATDLTLPDEFIRARRVAQWRSVLPDLARRPSIFLLLAEAPRSPSTSPHERRRR